ncbi:MAG: DsbA family oxidoreductase [Balneolaceae bacterium]|nr:DsbA family oxidoreductase [Balneolaceae bacterium]
MKIDIWSDVVCPFCYIAKRHLQQAMEEFPELEVSISWRSFELDPKAPKNAEMGIYDSLAKKYGQNRDWAKQVTRNMLEMARNAGLEFNMEALKPTNSFDAHQLLHLAKQEGKQMELKERLFSAYFVEGKHIADHKTLTTLGEQVGLPVDRIQKTLKEEEFASAVNHDVMQAKNIGIEGVPFFLINHKYSLSGAQPVETFIQLLHQVNEGQVNINTNAS